MKQFIPKLLTVAGLAIGHLTSFAQTTPAASTPDDVRATLEMVRADVRAVKIRALNETMQLTGPEADKFWPVYRQYEKELAAVADQKIASIREFTERLNNGTLDNPASDRLAQQLLKNIQARLDLWKKYQKKVARALSPARAMQFLQVEHQMALYLDVNIARDLPSLHMVTRPAKP